MKFNTNQNLCSLILSKYKQENIAVSFNGFYSIDDEKDFRYGALGDGALKKLNDLIKDLTRIRDRIVELEEKDKNDGYDL